VAHDALAHTFDTDFTNQRQTTIPRHGDYQKEIIIYQQCVLKNGYETRRLDRS
jgi:hypothetical protein